MYRILIALVGLVLAAASTAAPIAPVSYDMINGNGRASGGSFNYWDRQYDGLVSTTTDGAFLSGGTGDLTDGVIATQNWFQVENTAGTGPYVGWLQVNPTITFNFDPGTSINAISLHLDDSNGAGGVAPPISVRIEAAGYDETFQVADPPSGAPFSVTYDNLSLTGPVDITLTRQNAWIFLSEVEFDGTVPAPAPMVVAALALLALRRRVR